MWKDFKEFAFKGNVIDLAIAVVIGAAFSGIVSSLVDNIITPLIEILLNGMDFTDLTYTIGNAEILYGMFIQSVIDFFIIALSIFFIIRLFMAFKRKKEVEVIKLSSKANPQEKLLKEIRDILKEKNK
ncbi:large conductance mechanosensitive channel protein MscL [Virgibacillus salexigens]|uniref:Large-conductance mechanosensitive channel n=1 Tax=Virgibacillus kapii TaxID=1638645 RepID=A0ABQ2DUM4_9BACI|nr:large conductance mechanosensitive channel protein MscL [Virgibacillus kapii]GGJ70927.1 large-conductance mechanosensitive channel [Virgibacillus kapii]